MIKYLRGFVTGAYLTGSAILIAMLYTVIKATNESARNRYRSYRDFYKKED